MQHVAPHPVVRGTAPSALRRHVGLIEYGDGLPQGPQLCHQGLYEVSLPHPRYTLD